MDIYESYSRSPLLNKRRSRQRRFVVLLVLLLIIGSGLFAYAKIGSLNSADPQFPTNTDVVIEEGMTIRDISNELEEKHVVRSSLYLYTLLVRTFKDKFVQAGTYHFPEPMTTRAVADAIISGSFLSPAQKILFPEGFSVKNMHEYLPERFATTTLDSYQEYEGFLFPDTYYFKADDTLDTILTTLRATYEARIDPLRERIATSGYTEREIVTLASLIEREANDPESMNTVAGILKHRLRIDMPLQVDATFDYLLGKTSSELTEEDLDIDSPYNTYLHTGLPPTPIANPGLAAITAALDAKESPYLYYLTGNDGKFYYAKTFEEHKQNKMRYLR